MATLAVHRHLSTARAKKFRENMLLHGFKRVQKWVFDIENVNIQAKMRQEALSLRQTPDMKDWDAFSIEQMTNIES